MADIQINELLESTTAANSDWIAIDNGTATKKISVQNFNSTGAASAAQSAAAAAQSATDATSAKNAAVQAKDDTQALITSAQTIVSNAQTYAGEASTSANTASTAASTATAQAAIATNQANLAAGYAQNVDNFAKNAKSWAVGGTGTRQGEDTDNSKYYSQQAHDSEINAAASESNASSSESNAATSEGIASAAASSAEADALRAEGYAVGSQNGTPVVSGTYYQNNAKYYKEQAYTSETNAASSEYNAGLSETAAAASESAASSSKLDSEAWSVGERNGVPVGPSDPTYHNNAKFWADVASGGVSGVSSFNGRSGNVIPAAHDYAADLVDFDNSVNGFTADDVQEAIEEVNTSLSTLDSSLASVAKSGAYSDLSGTPTLATVATSGAYSDLSGTPTLATVATSGAYSDLSGTPSLGTAAALNVPTTGDASTTEVVKGDDSRLTDSRTPTSHTHTTSDITDYSAVTIDSIGTASSTETRYQRVGIGTSYTTIDGTMYMEQTKTLSTSADVTYTFTNSAIKADSVIMPFASIYGIIPKSITVSAGSCAVVIPKYSSAASCKIRIYIR